MRSMLIMSVMCFVAGSALAAPLSLVNAGFEAGVPYPWSSTSFTGWTNATGAHMICIDGGTEGTKAIQLDVIPGGGTAQIIQYTSHVIQSGYIYTLKTDARSTGPTTGATHFFLGMNAIDGGGGSIQIAGQGWNSATTPVYGSDNVWRTYSVSFIADATHAGKTLSIYNTTQGSGALRYGQLDNVVLSAVPVLPLVNAGFEAGVPYPWSSASFNGWTNSTGANIICIDGGTEGKKAIQLDVTTGGGTAQIIQYTSHVIQKGDIYTLTTDARSTGPVNGATQFLLSMDAIDGGGGSVQVVGQGWNSGTTPVYGSDNVWRTYSVSFTADATHAGKTLSIYNATQGSGALKYGQIDTVVLSWIDVPPVGTMIVIL